MMDNEVNTLLSITIKTGYQQPVMDDDYNQIIKKDHAKHDFGQVHPSYIREIA